MKTKAKHERRRDPEGYTTKVTRLGTGEYGVRVFDGDVMVAERTVATKADTSTAIGELLRMIDKGCNPSSMASASRDRRYCR